MCVQTHTYTNLPLTNPGHMICGDVLTTCPSAVSSTCLNIMFHHPEHLLKKSGSPSHSKEGRRRKKPQVNENQFSFLPPFLFFLLPFSEQKSDKLVAPSLQHPWDEEVRADMETDPPWRPWVCLPEVSGAQSRPVP